VTAGFTERKVAALLPKTTSSPFQVDEVVEFIVQASLAPLPTSHVLPILCFSSLLNSQHHVSKRPSKPRRDAADRDNLPRLRSRNWTNKNCGPHRWLRRPRLRRHNFSYFRSPSYRACRNTCFRLDGMLCKHSTWKRSGYHRETSSPS
jgi:hypothetical protein